MGVKGLKIRTCIERRFNYSKDITDRSETSVQKQNSDKCQLREFLFLHNNAIAMKPGLFKKTFSIMKTIKLFYTKLSLYSCFRFQKIFAGAIKKINKEMPSVSAKLHLVNSPFYFVSGKTLLYPSIV